MKIFIALSLFFSFSALADFSEEHASLCQSPEIKKLMGKEGSCQLTLSKIDTPQMSSTCEGKLTDIICKVMMLKSTDSSSMNLVCGDSDSPLVSQVIPAQLLSYNVSAVVKTSKGDFVTINDPKEYHLFSGSALEVQLARGETVNARMVMTLQDKAISLTDVKCQ